jgi:site-specific DNA-methyltransferase (adenine-specific)
LQQLARPRPTSNKKPGAVGARSFRDDYCQTVTGYPRNLLAFKSVHRPRHPTQKPLDLVEYLVETHSRPGDLVLDFSMGSGTTGVASLKCDRRFIGIEQDESYFEIACDRIRQA